MQAKVSDVAEAFKRVDALEVFPQGTEVTAGSSWLLLTVLLVVDRLHSSTQNCIVGAAHSRACL